MGRERKQLEDLTIADDFMFGQVMGNVDIAKGFLERFFEKEIRTIQRHTLQSTEQAEYASHGVRFDVEFTGDGVVYDIEMQRQGETRALKTQNMPATLLRRVRYYQASIDTRYLKVGMRYSDLPEVCIIFVCDFDPFGFGKAMYSQRIAIPEIKQYVDNGAKAFFLNARFTDPNAPKGILPFLKYVSGEISRDPYTMAVDEIVQYSKLDPNVRRSFMSLDEMLEDSREEGREEGRAAEREKAARVLMRHLGTTYDKALQLLSEQEQADSTIQPMKLP